MLEHKVLRPDRYSLTTPPAAPAPPAPSVGDLLRPVARIARYKRWWGVYDESGRLVRVCVYRKGAMEALRRLGRAPPARAQLFLQIFCSLLAGP